MTNLRPYQRTIQLAAWAGVANCDANLDVLDSAIRDTAQEIEDNERYARSALVSLRRDIDMALRQLDAPTGDEAGRPNTYVYGLGDYPRKYAEAAATAAAAATALIRLRKVRESLKKTG